MCNKQTVLAHNDGIQRHITLRLCELGLDSDIDDNGNDDARDTAAGGESTGGKTN